MPRNADSHRLFSDPQMAQDIEAENGTVHFAPVEPQAEGIVEPMIAFTHTDSLDPSVKAVKPKT